MLIYGGKVSIFENSNRLYSYDLETNDWELLNTNKTTPQTMQGYEFPLHLDSHNAELYETEQTKEMLVFGGFIGGSVAQYSRSIIAFDLEKNIWSFYYLQGKKVLEGKKKEKAEPKKRANAGMGIYQNIVYVFGGTNGKKKLNDMWKFDLVKRYWSEIVASDLNFPDVNC